MVHPVQRVCCADGCLYYAISQTIGRYNIESGEIEELWKAEPISAAEKHKNLEHRAVIELVVNGDHLVWMCEDKNLRVYDLRASKLLSEREMVKRGCAMDVQGDIIIVGDKFGDVYHYSLLEPAESNEKEGQTTEITTEKLPIVGHVSMLTSVLLTSPAKDDKRYIISADRDEHIRVSIFPDGHNIQSYCLGHSQFVSSLLIPRGTNTLVSAGGDEYLAFWDYLEGTQVRTSVMKDAVAASKTQEIGLAVLKLLEVPSLNAVAVLIEDLQKLFLYSLSSDSDEALIAIDLVAPALDMAIHESSLFITYDTTNNEESIPNFDLFVLNPTDKSYSRRELPQLNSSCRESSGHVTYKSHKAELMRKRTKAELEAIRLYNAQSRDGDDEEVGGDEDEALSEAIEADKLKTEKTIKKAKLST